MYEYKCKVTRVVDGDTVDVIIDLGFDISYSSRVRLFGIDTPESRTRDKDEKARGLISKDFLKSYLDKGGVVIRTRKDKKGKFGRLLGELINPYKEEENANKMLLKEGHAVEYNGGKR